MPILTEIFRDRNTDIHGKTIHRVAVRAVVLRDNYLLMVYSPVNGDYKFPGGGVEKNEKLANALQREVLEECGTRITQINHEIGSIIEYAIEKELDFDTFKMTSHYFLCEANDFVTSQALDDYEAKLGFQPVWVEVDSAIQTNNSRLEQPEPPRWTVRDTFMLKYIKANLL